LLRNSRILREAETRDEFGGGGLIPILTGAVEGRPLSYADGLSSSDGCPTFACGKRRAETQ